MRESTGEIVQVSWCRWDSTGEVVQVRYRLRWLAKEY